MADRQTDQTTDQWSNGNKWQNHILLIDMQNSTSKTSPFQKHQEKNPNWIWSNWSSSVHPKRPKWTITISHLEQHKKTKQQIMFWINCNLLYGDKNFRWYIYERVYSISDQMPEIKQMKENMEHTPYICRHG